jgi:hypothetical protein
MPSSYSPNLRIELIAPGEQAGTWGTTTNTNLGTLVEASIAGYVTVSVISANQAFTAANGAADQARNAIIELTTTTGADFAVYAPPESKQYTIVNSSAYTATVYNSTALGNTTAAGAGVAIPAGKTMTIFSDGENFGVQNTLIVSDVIGEIVAEDGSVAVTQAISDNTTKLATTAFVQAIRQSLHPVGSIYINATNNTNPATLLGFGTWTAFGAGRVPVGFDASDPSFDTAEETGGSKNAIVVSHTHTATVTDPGHIHSVTNVVPGSQPNDGGGGGDIEVFRGTFNTNTATTGITVANSTEGSSGTNANLQPYITVYMWKRTA